MAKLTTIITGELTQADITEMIVANYAKQNIVIKKSDVVFDFNTTTESFLVKITGTKPDKKKAAKQKPAAEA
jgi:hypothetical protein